eukprot:scaffold109731_cov33-Prasinocladus_malaysianus.AAC.1
MIPLPVVAADLSIQSLNVLGMDISQAAMSGWSNSRQISPISCAAAPDEHVSVGGTGRGASHPVGAAGPGEGRPSKPAAGGPAARGNQPCQRDTWQRQLIMKRYGKYLSISADLIDIKRCCPVADISIAIVAGHA